MFIKSNDQMSLRVDKHYKASFSNTFKPYHIYKMLTLLNGLWKNIHFNIFM